MKIFFLSLLLDIKQFRLCLDWPACSHTSPAGISSASSWSAPAVSGAPAHCPGPTGKSGSSLSVPSAASPLSLSPSRLETPFGVYTHTTRLNATCTWTIIHTRPFTHCHYFPKPQFFYAGYLNVVLWLCSFHFCRETAKLTQAKQSNRTVVDKCRHRRSNRSCHRSTLISNKPIWFWLSPQVCR